ncbi:MAG: phosphopantetheine-binding protein [Pseudomonadota bacterium]
MSEVDTKAVEDKIIEIVANQRRVDASTLSLSDRLEDIEIESIDLVEIIFAIEDEFDVDVPQDRDAMKLDTLQDVVDGIKRLIAEKNAA